MRACGAPARLGDEDSKLYAACADMRSAGARLLARAQEAGTVRVDVSITDLISVAIGVAWAAEQTITTRQEHREVVTRLLSNAMFGFAAQSPDSQKQSPSQRCVVNGVNGVSRQPRIAAVPYLNLMNSESAAQ